jgi:hypothetical protein
MPVSSTSQVSVVQMLVTLSQPTREARLYTDSREVLLEAALRPGQGMSAVELLDGEPEPEMDLWQIGHRLFDHDVQLERLPRSRTPRVEKVRLAQRSSRYPRFRCEAQRKCGRFSPVFLIMLHVVGTRFRCRTRNRLSGLESVMESVPCPRRVPCRQRRPKASRCGRQSPRPGSCRPDSRQRCRHPQCIPAS